MEPLLLRLRDSGYGIAAEEISKRLSSQSIERLAPSDAKAPLEQVRRIYKTRLGALGSKDTPYAIRLASEIQPLVENLSSTQDTEIELVSFVGGGNGYLIFVGHPSQHIHGCCYVVEGGGSE